MTFTFTFFSCISVYPVTFFIVVINLCLYTGLLQFCAVFLFFLVLTLIFKPIIIFSTFIPLFAFPTVLFPLLLLLSHCSHVQLCATPQMAAHQASPFLGFSRQEHWSGLPFPSPMHESESESEVAHSCPTLSDATDCSPPGSSVHGTLQARVLEWGAIVSPCS